MSGKHRAVARLGHIHAVAALLVLTACQQAPLLAPAGQAAPGSAAAANTGTGEVRVNVSALLKRIGEQQLLAANVSALGRIVEVRLTATGEGVAEASTSVPWPPASQGDILSLRVPVGANRLLTFEGHDVGGRPVVVVRAPVAVVGTESQEIPFSAYSDTIGRVIQRLADIESTTPKVSAVLGSDKLVPSIQALVSQVTGYDAAKNTYTGLAPNRVRTEVIANMLRDGGVAGLPATPTAELLKPAAATVHVTVVDGTGAKVPGAKVDIFDPLTPQATSDTGGQAQFTGVPPGIWVARAQVGTQASYGTLATLDNEGDVNVLLNMDAQEPSPATPIGIAIGDSLSLALAEGLDAKAGAAKAEERVAALFKEAPSELDALDELDAAQASAVRTAKDLANVETYESSLDGVSFNAVTGNKYQLAQASAACTVQGPRTTILYVNGMLTLHNNFLATVDILRSRLQAYNLVPGYDLDGIFNASGADPASASYEVCSGLFKHIGIKKCATVTDGGESAIQYFQTKLGKTTDIALVTTIANRIEAELKNGRKVILIPHSQGNLMVQQALELIKTRLDRGDYAKYGVRTNDDINTSVGTINLASPVNKTVQWPLGTARFVTHVSVDRDIISHFPDPVNVLEVLGYKTLHRVSVAAAAAHESDGSYIKSSIASEDTIAHHAVNTTYLRDTKDTFQGADTLPWKTVSACLTRYDRDMVNKFKQCPTP